MKKQLSLVIFIGLITALPTFTGRTSGAADISGTWKFSVDLDGGGHGEPALDIDILGAYGGSALEPVSET